MLLDAPRWFSGVNGVFVGRREAGSQIDGVDRRGVGGVKVEL